MKQVNSNIHLVVDEHSVVKIFSIHTELLLYLVEVTNSLSFNVIHDHKFMCSVPKVNSSVDSVNISKNLVH